jgi:CheY-like chemotaxis protein
MTKTILIADDNPRIRTQLRQVFESEKDYEVCAEAANGREAIELARRLRPNLIVLDLSMPVMDGLMAANELKRLMPDVPIILFTQHADLGKHLLDSVGKIDRVVSKGAIKELVEHVRSLMPL